MVLENASPLIAHIELHDVYQHNFTFTISYHNLDQNLTKEDVEPIRQQIMAVAADKYQASLVGSV